MEVGMAQTFHFGPFVFATHYGVPPGHEQGFWYTGFGHGTVFQVTAYPFHLSGATREVRVTGMSVHASEGSLTLFFTIKNVGPDPVNYMYFVSETVA
jgi:hypothetical protein